jgi:copper(I)-binding protein
MRRRTLLALLALMSRPTWAGDPASVTASNAWAPPSLAGAHNGVAYLTLANAGAVPDRLLSASTPVAKRAELHRSEMRDGVMTMRPEGALALAPGERVTLAPGGLHLMLLGLERPLAAGERFPITLAFEHRPPLTIDCTVAAGPRGDHPAGLSH